MIIIDEYQIKRIDKYNLVVLKERLSKNNKTVLDKLGYYSTVKSAVISIIQHKTEAHVDHTSLSDFIIEYDRVSKRIIEELKETKDYLNI